MYDYIIRWCGNSSSVTKDGCRTALVIIVFLSLVVATSLGLVWVIENNPALLAWIGVGLFLSFVVYCVRDPQ